MSTLPVAFYIVWLLLAAISAALVVVVVAAIIFIVFPCPASMFENPEIDSLLP